MDADSNRGTPASQANSDLIAQVLTVTLQLFGNINNMFAVAMVYFQTKEGAELLDRFDALLLALRKGAMLPEAGLFNLPLLALFQNLGVQATRDRADKANVDNYGLGDDRMHRADDLIRKGLELKKNPPAPKPKTTRKKKRPNP